MKVDMILDIIMAVFMMFAIFCISFEKYKTAKKSGEIIMRRKYVNNVILKSFIMILLGVLLLYGIYTVYKEKKISTFLMVLYNIYIWPTLVTVYSKKAYIICENGIKLGFGGFIKWQDFDSYEIENEILKIKSNKKSFIYKMKLLPEHIEKMKGILKFNIIYPS